MQKPLTSMSLARTLLPRLQSMAPLQGLDCHVVPTDPEAIDTTIAEDCILRVRVHRSGPTAARSYSATLALAYPSTEPEYDRLWSIRSRSSSDRYFPLICNLGELTDLPASGLPATEGAVDLLAQKIVDAVHRHVWLVRTRGAARAELERGREATWYNLVAVANWLPVVILLDEGARAAHAFAVERLAQQHDSESASTSAYRKFVSNLQALAADA